MFGVELCDVQYALRTARPSPCLPRTTPCFARRGTRLRIVQYALRTAHCTALVAITAVLTIFLTLLIVAARGRLFEVEGERHHVVRGLYDAFGVDELRGVGEVAAVFLQDVCEAEAEFEFGDKLEIG